MSVVIGVDLGRDRLRVAALVDDRPVLAVNLPALVAWRDDRVVVGDEARDRPAIEQLGGLPDWLERVAAEGDGPATGPVTSLWPSVGGVVRSPAEAVAWLLRAALVTVEDRYGPVLGAAFAVEPSLGAVGRRAIRDAAVIAGLPVSRQISSPACAALMVASARDGVYVVCDTGTGGLTLAVLERFAGAIHGLAHVRDPDLGVAALDGAFATGAGQRRLDELCQRVLQGSGSEASELVDVLAIGAGALRPALLARLGAAFQTTPRVLGDPTATSALGAAVAARMFMAEPAALFLDTVMRPLALADAHGLEPLVEGGTIAPTRTSRVVPTLRADQSELELELWEIGPRTRPYARYKVSGLPAAPAGDAIASCEVMLDADLIPSLRARELVSGTALTVVTTAEAAIDPELATALRARVTAWRP